ncbi:MAG: hypothetical protein ACFCVA_02800 [Gammaproteobacteria bacterium]
MRYLLCLFLLLPPILTGCASIAKGVTEGVMSSQQKGEKESASACIVHGPPFEGLATTLERQTAAGPSHSTKVVMVHGIGKHLPGYSGRLRDNLASALGLDVVQEKFKEFTLLPPPPRPDMDLGDAFLGSLRVYRYTDQDESRELLFYELTWSGITEPLKEAILAYDDSYEYAYRRASLNRTMKSFFNSHIPDPIIYTGDVNQRILVAVGQSLCWMASGDWDDLPNDGRHRCDPLNEKIAEHLRKDEMAIITHSLGSRIALDALQSMAQSAALRRADFARLAQALQEKTMPVYMLANQLPLLQLGFVEPAVTGKIPDYCRPTGEHYRHRLFRQVRVVAFSDPNDILSYALPAGFADRHIDSQICPQVVNVSVNVAPVMSIPVIGEVANPLMAHNDYEADERVIGLMVHGIGTPHTAPAVQTVCKWMKTRD